MDIRTNLFTKRAVRRCNGLPGEGGESPSLGVFKNHLDMELRAVVELRAVSEGRMAGLRLDSMILKVLILSQEICSNLNVYKRIPKFTLGKPSLLRDSAGYSPARSGCAVGHQDIPYKRSALPQSSCPRPGPR